MTTGSAGGDRAAVRWRGTPITVSLEAESDWSAADTETKQSIEFELVWWRDVASAEAGTVDVRN